VLGVVLQRTILHPSLREKLLTMVTAIVTFADRRMAHIHRRFRLQVREFGAFDRAFIWTEGDLDGDFCESYGFLLRSEVRGFGYWVWKPQVILQALELLNEGDILVYSDSGNHLNPRGKQRFFDYLRKVKYSETGILGFELKSREGDWTKGDLLDFYSVRGDRGVVDSGQIQAGLIIIQKRSTTANFIRKWLQPFALDAGLVDDSPSRSPNEPGFREHRHDQSVFSLIAKQEGVSKLSSDELYPSSDVMGWRDLGLMPFHQRRDKSTALVKLARRFVVSSPPLHGFLVKGRARAIALFRRV
jgi:hypothetical protein